MKVYIYTFGCRVNQCESEAILEVLIKSGHVKAETLIEADIVIFNSCTVTAESDRKLRQAISKVKKVNSSCITVLMGCMPQAFPDKAKKFEGIDIILGNFNKDNLADYISNFISNRQSIVSIESTDNLRFSNLPIANFSEHTRAFLKIQDGCNRFCSYCIIPYARGRIRSKPAEEIYDETRELAKNGYKEITFVGINLLSYGCDINEDLSEVIDNVSEIPGIQRIRFGSLEPDLINNDFLVRLSKNPKFCPHFHLSVQSGSNKILKSMHRLYTREKYLEIIKNVRKIFPDATITTDLMVGFPGETEADFQDSIDIIKQANFLKVHVFPYSRRPGTKAADMPEQILKTVKSERVKEVIKVSSQQTDSLLKNYIGKSVPVLYESFKNDGYYEGYTENYILVKAKSSCNLKGKILLTSIKETSNGYCIGEILQE